MSFARAVRSVLASASLAAAVGACQGDDNTLPLPPDAGVDGGAPDGHAGRDAGVDGGAPDGHAGGDAEGGSLAESGRSD